MRRLLARRATTTTAALAAFPVALLLLLTACDPTPFANAAPITTVVTPIGSETLDFAPSPGAMTISSPAGNTSGNLRMLFRSADAPTVTNEQSCMVISAQSAAYNQQGLALRVHTASGRTQSILVTKNIFPAVQTFINVHVFDSTAASTLTQLASFDYSAFFGNYFHDADHPAPQVPLPWSVCARAEGTTVRVKAWRGDEAQPAWDDAEPHNHRVELPDASWVYPGQAGWFVGHLAPTESTTVTGLSTATLD